MEFSLTQEQEMIVESVSAFVAQELYPHEAEVERTGFVSPERVEQIKRKAIESGFYAANMPEDLGGGGLDAVSIVLLERELGRASFALQYLVARPSNILRPAAARKLKTISCLPCAAIDWNVWQ